MSKGKGQQVNATFTQAKPPSIEQVLEKMKPVDEDSLRLPRSFAHTMRLILESEMAAWSSGHFRRSEE